LSGPAAALIGGDRLHLQHGPIDLIIGVDAEPLARTKAFAAAQARFSTILDGLVEDLATHRSPLVKGSPTPRDPVACRMYSAARPFVPRHFLAPMIAVAGSVADEVLAAMTAAVPVARAYVNNGGDIAVHLGEGARFSVAMATQSGRDLGRICFNHSDGVGGIASSGTGGRSHSLGIAENVTVLAENAASADVAATLIANTVDLPDHPGIRRTKACDLSPDSDLGDLLVVTGVPRLGLDDIRTAIERGECLASEMIETGQIKAASLFLQNQSVQVGGVFDAPPIEAMPA